VIALGIFFQLKFLGFTNKIYLAPKLEIWNKNFWYSSFKLILYGMEWNQIKFVMWNRTWEINAIVRCSTGWSYELWLFEDFTLFNQLFAKQKSIRAWGTESFTLITHFWEEKTDSSFTQSNTHSAALSVEKILLQKSWEFKT